MKEERTSGKVAAQGTQKKDWASPELQRIDPGSAEDTGSTAFDGVTKS